MYVCVFLTVIVSSHIYGCFSSFANRNLLIFEEPPPPPAGRRTSSAGAAWRGPCARACRRPTSSPRART